jgi:hypothetical protein
MTSRPQEILLAGVGYVKHDAEIQGEAGVVNPIGFATAKPIVLCSLPHSLTAKK